MDEDVFLVQREKMVREQLARRGIQSARVLEAMRSVPRHSFVPLEHRHLAYADGPLPIGQGQTISQPYIVALMTQLLDLQPGEERPVLEIGTGSGYQAAVLAQLAARVHTVERFPDLSRIAGRILHDLGIENVQLHIGDGTLGLKQFAPFSGILVTAAAPETPRELLDQLANEARLVIPVGGRGQQQLELWQRQGSQFSCTEIAPVAFVPLIGKYGWQEGAGHSLW